MLPSRIFNERKVKRDRQGKFDNKAGNSLLKYRSKVSSKGLARKLARADNARKAARGGNRLYTKTTGADIPQSTIRSARNNRALSALEKKGVVLPPGTRKAASQLKKGQTIRLADGRRLRRSKDNKYTITRK